MGPASAEKRVNTRRIQMEITQTLWIKILSPEKSQLLISEKFN